VAVRRALVPAVAAAASSSAAAAVSHGRRRIEAEALWGWWFPLAVDRNEGKQRRAEWVSR